MQTIYNNGLKIGVCIYDKFYVHAQNNAEMVSAVTLPIRILHAAAGHYRPTPWILRWYHYPYNL